ncbi:hypothetical protein [Paracidovorax oryzae]|uniref:hypothetical protein n=1 Tax=Paracidovorax oryzae TaxID=862720 RepID=UPI0012EB11F8|nr:hypothetical protein [Paracidovorax oryzae]
MLRSVWPVHEKRDGFGRADVFYDGDLVAGGLRGCRLSEYLCEPDSFVPLAKPESEWRGEAAEQRGTTNNLEYAMMRNNKELSKIVEKVSQKYSVESDYSKLICFMVDCLELIPANNSEADRFGMRTAKNFCQGKATDDELKEARIACWKYIDQNGGIQDIANAKTRSTRAILCALYKDPPSEEISEILSWFVKVLLLSENNCEYLREKIAMHFPKAFSLP